MEISEVVRDCVEQADINLSKKTAATYKQGMLRFIEYLEGAGIKQSDDISRIKISHFQQFPAWLGKQQRFKRGTRRVYLSGLNNFLEFLILADYISPTQNEMLRFKRAVQQVNRKRESHLPKFPPEEALDKMLNKARKRRVAKPIKQRDLAAILLLFTSGCRNNELCSLDVD